MGTSVAVNTSRDRYARCAGCGEIKDLGPDGLLRAHNRYLVNGANGTSVEVARCPGSGRRPQDAEPQSV